MSEDRHPESVSITTRLSAPRFCIVAQNAYSALRDSRNGHIGGVEIQTAALARWLSGKGYDVRFVTWAEGSLGDERVGGVDVLKMCAADAGIRRVRFFYPRLTSFVSALERANADIYYQNCAESYTGIAAAWCALRRRTFVYSTASDADCRRERPEWQKAHEWLLYRYGLRTADLVIAQTKAQLRLLESDNNVKATQVLMPGVLTVSRPASVGDWRTRRGTGGVVAWVGRIDPRKRLECLFEIARLMPGTTFRVVAPATKNTDYERAQEIEARSIPNVEWLGRVGRDRMSAIYLDADCLCCTSLYEGFPNTFLEAWSHGTPVVSSFDPDDLIEERQLGIRAGSVSDFVEGIRLLTNSEMEWQTMSENAARYYREHHSPESALARFEAALLAAWTAKNS
jgi:glycosyltransferase involved in cell wall biosynthesis